MKDKNQERKRSFGVTLRLEICTYAQISVSITVYRDDVIGPSKSVTLLNRNSFLLNLTNYKLINIEIFPISNYLRNVIQIIIYSISAVMLLLSDDSTTVFMPNPYRLFELMNGDEFKRYLPRGSLNFMNSLLIRNENVNDRIRNWASVSLTITLQFKTGSESSPLY